MIVLGVVLLDPVLGIRKTNIGIKDGRVVGVGRAGNPDVLDGVALEVDAHTAMITGEGLLATPGIVDSHVHLSNADLAAAALSAGVTTIVGMGIGGVWDVGANPRHNLHSLIAGWADVPVNAAFLARGSSTSAALLEEAVLSGCAGFKVHEDWGATPDVIDTCLGVAEAADLPVALHTDTLNESGYLADTLDAVDGRTVHAYHVEGGGGHPDLLSIVSRPNVLTSSTTPTLPLTPSTVAELHPMTLTVHRGHAHVPSDAAIAASRIREHAISAENWLHDQGAISIVNSDALGMGRIAETARRTWQLASVQATLAGETGPDVDNNARVLRYLAKLTHNPAVAHGIAGARRVDPAGPARRHRAVEPGVVRRPARARDQVRVRGVGRGRLGIRFHPAHPAAPDAGVLRRARRRARAAGARLRVAARRPGRAPARPHLLPHRRQPRPDLRRHAAQHGHPARRGGARADPGARRRPGDPVAPVLLLFR